MSRAYKLAGIAVFLAIIVGLVIWAVKNIFIEGTTSGPDFIACLQSGHVAPDAISSIEVVDPAVGHTPFTASELDSLARRAEIDSPVTVRRLVTLLRGAQPGWAHRSMNHPNSTFSVYLKVNAKDGFFWLYCNVHQDANGAVLSLDSNTRNATNPNGATSYHLEDFSEVLTILERGRDTK